MSKQKLVIGCATVIEEMLPLMPADTEYDVLDFGLHTNPAKLRHVLQDRINEAMNASGGLIKTIILGYGLCSQGVIGLSAADCTLIVPRVDDCIAIFLGSAISYSEQSKYEPGTYYLTKGWIEVGDSPFAEHERMIASRGRDHADRIIHLMLKNYKRLALINTGQYALDHYRDYAQRTARNFGLRYEEIRGSTAMIEKMLNGPWDDDFIVTKPGQPIRFEDFFNSKRNMSEGFSAMANL